MVRYGVLGALEVVGPDGPIAIRGARRRALLVRLVVAANRVVPFETVADDVWDQQPSPGAASTLRSHILLLRRLLGPEAIETHGHGYLLAAEPGTVDIQCFEADLEQAEKAQDRGDHDGAADHFSAALAWWRGPALLDVAESPWAAGDLARLDERRSVAVEGLLRAQLEIGQVAKVIAGAEEAIGEHPLREQRWALLMLALYRSGRQAEALRAYQRLRAVLGEGLGIEPSAELAALEQAIILHRPELIGQSSTTINATLMDPARDGRHHNLPRQLTTFIGRDAELERLAALVAGHRLVTVTGTGGAGKTRLALEVARSTVDRFPDGVWFIDLATVQDPELVPIALAETLSIGLGSLVAAADAVVDAVSGQRALLLLDNCEHVVDSAASLVDRLLRAGADLRVLATSRQPLRVPSEQLWRIPPLAVPADLRTASPEQLRLADGVRLFAARAADAGIELELDPGTMAEIVVGLDGMPLAVELAAARVAGLGLDGLRDRLTNRLGLLTGGPRSAVPRQQTLRAAIEWSYQLMDDDERAALCCLSVFPSSFSLPAAEAVVAAAGLEVAAVAPIVLELVAKSMVMAEAAEPGQGDRARRSPRFRMLETIRQFAAEATDGGGGFGREAARRAHADHFSRLAGDAGPELVGPRQAEWLAELGLEHANLRAALDELSVRPDRQTDELVMLAQLRRYWFARGLTHQCMGYVLRALDAMPPEPGSDAQIAGWSLAAEIAFRDDLTAAERFARRALELAAGHDGRATTIRATGLLGMVCGRAGRWEEGQALCEQAAGAARRLGDPVLVGECLTYLAICHINDADRCLAIHLEAVACAESSGDRLFEALGHSNVGNSCLAAGDLVAARRHLEASLELFAELESEEPVAVLNLGWVLLAEGDVEAAATRFAAALVPSQRSGWFYEIGLATLGLACCATATGDDLAAARLHGWAEHEYVGVWEEPERTYRLDDLAVLADRLGARFEAEREAGRCLGRSDGIDLAMRVRGVLRRQRRLRAT